ncbi:SDR family oxidoreductase [Mycobacterium sp. 155]|uniref:SDR family oxidoreductase n=1 Tax=Mycobacterium sp. 155 TaxID=1157943 RepID=UPI00351059A6
MGHRFGGDPDGAQPVAYPRGEHPLEFGRGAVRALGYAVQPPVAAVRSAIATARAASSSRCSGGSAVPAVYAASKAAVEQLTRICSRELGSRGITANTISAGPTDTDLLRENAVPQALDGAAAMTALGRIGQPVDIANLVALIARPDSGWMTGQNIRADGGLS